MLSKINASQTKHGIVKIIEIVKENRLHDYLNDGFRSGFSIDEPQLRATLGLDKDNALPTYWDEINYFPEQIGFFCLIAIIFTHESFIEAFADSSTDNMRGVLNKNQFDNIKTFTNIRGILVASGASSNEALKSDYVSYDFSELFKSGEVGQLVKKLLYDRLKKTNWLENPTGPNKEHIRGFHEQCFAYKFHRVFSLETKQFYEWLEGNALTKENENSIIFNFSEEVEVDTHLIVSLATKPFLILSGASGTGKTYGIRKLASSINPLKDRDDNFNITFIPVEAGWKDGRSVIGYRNPFSEEGEIYQPTQLINMLLKANYHKHESIPFFVLFDEMNLSHVEMYFARFLALLETARHEGINQVPLLSTNELLLLEKYYKNNNEYLEYLYESIKKEGLFIPSNVFFIGTVNIDETTYMFSPKVLDRSFVIERNTEVPSNILNQSLINSDYKATINSGELNRFLLSPTNVRKVLNDMTSPEREALKHVIDFLDQVYELVEGYYFGYRVVVECCEYYLKAKELYSVYNIDLDWLNNEDKLFDEILMQKILPKIHGNRKQLIGLLKNLMNFCKDEEKVKFEKSYKKLNAMELNLSVTGYCGFIC